jgi:hypothetical protein
MHRAAMEAGTDPEALLPAMVGLCKSDEPGVEDLIREVFDRLKSSEEVLLGAAAALIASEPGISVLRSLVGDVHLSGETRSRLQICLEIADELAVDDDR